MRIGNQHVAVSTLGFEHCRPSRHLCAVRPRSEGIPMTFVESIAWQYRNNLNVVYGYASVVGANRGVPVGSVALRIGGLEHTKIGTAVTYLAKLGATDVVATFAAMNTPPSPDMIDEVAAPRFQLYVWATPRGVTFWKHPIAMLDDGTIVADMDGWTQTEASALASHVRTAWTVPTSADVLEMVLDELGANVRLR